MHKSKFYYSALFIILTIGTIILLSHLSELKKQNITQPVSTKDTQLTVITQSEDEEISTSDNKISISYEDTLKNQTAGDKITGDRIKLPDPQLKSETSLEETLSKRRSVRKYSERSIDLKTLSQILWAAQGINDKNRQLRTAPSAGALYPLEIYVLVGNVSELESGVYKYNCINHELIKISSTDKRNQLSQYSAQPQAIKNAPITLVFAAVISRTSVKYGERAERYVHIEVGHSAQNVCLQVISLGLSTVTIGAFQDEPVKNTLSMEKNENPFYILPIGYKQ